MPGNTFFEELKRRNVVKASIAYLVVSWILLQVVSNILPIVEAPAWILKTFSFFLVIGFPIWIIFSWVYEVTPEGLKKTAKVSSNNAITYKTNKRLNIVIIIGLISAMALSFYNRPKSITVSIGPEFLENTIAVLPFDDLSSGGDTEWFCDGITEDIRTSLAKIKGVKKVISHTSVKKYKGSFKTIPEIADELDVSYILEGSVRKHDNKIIVTAKLVDAADNRIWSNQYNNNFDKIFDIQNDVSKRIAQQLQIAISPEEDKSFNTVPTDNFEAYELYLRGRHLLHQRSPESANRSIEYLKESIRLDSAYAPAYVALAENYILQNIFIKNNEEKLIHRIKCRKAIDKALELDNDLAEAYISKGHMIGMYEWNWEEMKKMVDKGLEIEPNNSKGHMTLSMYYLIKSDFTKSIEESLIAERLDPLNPMIGSYVGYNYYLAQDYSEAIDQYEKVLKVFPNDPMTWGDVAEAQFFSGKKEAATDSWVQFFKIMGSDDMADIFATETLDVAIDKWYRGALGGDELYCSNPTTIAKAHMLIDKEEVSFKYLEIAYKYHDENLPFYLLLPHFYPLHDNPRFKDLVVKTGVTLPQVDQPEFVLKD